MNDLLYRYLLDEILDYISKETGEWDDPTGDMAVMLAENEKNTPSNDTIDIL